MLGGSETRNLQLNTSTFTLIDDNENDTIIKDILQQLEINKSLSPSLKTINNSQWLEYYLQKVNCKLENYGTETNRNSFEDKEEETLTVNKVILERLLAISIAQEENSQIKQNLEDSV